MSPDVISFISPQLCHFWATIKLAGYHGLIGPCDQIEFLVYLLTYKRLAEMWYGKKE